LKQVVYNLMSNALKFTERGRIEVRVMAEDNARWRFEVEDTGRGMSADDLARVFADGDGNRLGLILTKRLVEAQGGRIGARSTPGKGSTFSAIFPRMMSLAGLAAGSKARS
jgi:signal transduction histidine kinase